VARKFKPIDYRTAHGINDWYKACGFRTNAEAISSLKVGVRSWYRWRNQGLPAGAAGNILAEKMARVLGHRSRAQ
jgi:hypothetical protein